MQTLNAIPEQFAAGTTLEYTKAFPDYPGNLGWEVTLYLAGPSASSEAQVTWNGAAYEFVFSSQNTGALAPGLYRWTERAEKEGRVVNLASGYVLITPDIAQATPGSMLSWAEKELAAVEAEITARTTGKMVESGQVAGRAFSKMPTDKLMAMRSELKAEVRQLRSGGRLGRQHLIDFKASS